ncbi:MAG: aryl-sulfate sulfotransferase [Chloroflexi bacterium]|nr:aryl-sulfate sulfotransferase [Chloroflexota bacterium]
MKATRILSASLVIVFALSSCAPLVPQPASPQPLASQIPPTQTPIPAEVPLSQSPAPQYYSPLQNAQYVSKDTTIIVRYGPTLTNQDLGQLKFNVSGISSGPHTGQTILADDHKTVIFRPASPFAPGEQVAVNVSAFYVDPETSYPPLSYTFTVAINQQSGSPGSSELSSPPVPGHAPRSAFPNFLTVPQDIPHYTFTAPQTSLDATEGYIFVAPFYWTESTIGSYLLILNDQGQLVYYQSAAGTLDAWDFKEQPNGLLSYYDQKNSTIYLMNSHYQVVDIYQAGDGYAADLHDFQLLSNGDALLMVYDAETVDMSRVAPGGKNNATVTGLVIQELDPSKNVIFEWRSWDHFSFFDSTATLTDQNIDLIHGNSLALSNDGNLLLSSRNLNEITKINLQTGDIIWRLGGKESMFTFVNSQPFAYQHDVRQLPNGDITVFDNHGTTQTPAPSQSVEYKVDETNKTVAEVWDFTHSPPVFGSYMGNTQRLPDGNTFISWGSPSQATQFAYVSMTEVAPDNQILFELSLDQPYVSYRAFRFPWQGSPNTLPALAYKIEGNTLTLGYSWNGATEVASYKVFGGNSPQSLSLIEENPKTDFETQSQFTNLPQGECYFQVAAMDNQGNEMARSKIISTDNANCPPVS